MSVILGWRQTMKFFSAVVCIALLTSAALAQDKATASKPTDDKLGNVPGLPACIKGAPVKGDPSKAFVLYAKATAGCDIPMHWHSASEDLTWITGSGQLKMKDSADQTATSGMFVHMPSKHPHALKCTTACTFYVTSDGA